MIKKTCDICRKEFDESDLILGHGIRHEVERLIVEDYPFWTDKNTICLDDYNKYRVKYVSSVIEEENGSIHDLEDSVVKNIQENDIITQNLNSISNERLTAGEIISDRVAAFGGSWTFIISFFSVLCLWIMINTIQLSFRPFDPYPFILLNLLLSCIAAIQAPVIMMSQNRQEMKDRMRSENDYRINLKSEIEVRTLHEKVDHLLLDQWSKMMKIQEIQIEILEEIKKNLDKQKKSSI